MGPYLLSITLVIVGLLVLVAVSVSTLSAVGRFRRTVTAVNGRIGDQTGLLRARTVAVRVGIRERRRVRIQTTTPRVPSGEPVQTGGRP